MALEYVKKNNNGKGNSYELSAKGKPGDPVDCSGLVSTSVEAGGEKDPNRGNKNGVTNIAGSTAKVDEDDVVPGNLVILNGSKHIGVIIKVERDKNGNILNMSMVDSGGQPSSGKSGPL